LSRCKPIDYKWTFKKKRKPDGTINKYKARLVVKGFTQKEGEDFFNTYSHVARLTTIRLRHEGEVREVREGGIGEKRAGDGQVTIAATSLSSRVIANRPTVASLIPSS
jgi:hypothetical protein